MPVGAGDADGARAPSRITRRVAVLITGVPKSPITVSNPTPTGTTTFYGLYLSLGTATPTSIQGNTVRNISSTATGTAYGIDVVAGAINVGTVAANTFGGTGAGQGISAAGPLYGLQVEGATTATIQDNTFAGFTTSSNSLLASVYLTGTGASTVSGNTITGLASLVTAGQLAGIYGTSSGALTISNNTISGLVNSAGSLTGVYISGSSPATVSGNTISGLSNALATMPRQENSQPLQQASVPTANFAEWFKQTIDKRNGK